MEESVSFISQARLLLGVGVASLQTLVVFRLINLDFFFPVRPTRQARLEQTVQLLWSVDSNLGRLESDRTGGRFWIIVVVGSSPRCQPITRFRLLRATRCRSAPEAWPVRPIPCVRARPRRRPSRIPRQMSVTPRTQFPAPPRSRSPKGPRPAD